MAVFKVPQRVIENCRAFTSVLESVHGWRSQKFVDEQLSECVQWSDARTILNSSLGLDAATVRICGLSRPVVMASASANSTPYRSSLTLLPGRPCDWPASAGEQ